MDGYRKKQSCSEDEQQLIYKIERLELCTIGMIRKRDVNLTDYPVAIAMLQLLVTFPPKFDDNGMIQRKAEKIQGYYAL